MQGWQVLPEAVIQLQQGKTQSVWISTTYKIIGPLSSFLAMGLIAFLVAASNYVKVVFMSDVIYNPLGNSIFDETFCLVTWLTK